MLLSLAASELNVLSLNVRGIRSAGKRKRLFSFLKREKFDVISLQETYVTKDVVETWKKEWGGDLVYTEGTCHSLGQLLLIKKGLVEEINTLHHSKRILAVSLTIADIQFCIVNVYAPNIAREKQLFYEEFVNVIESLEFENKIICGDFNCVADNVSDIISGEKHVEASVEQFNDALNACDLIDTWRIFHPDSKEFTWSKRNPFVARRIDYIFASTNMFSRVIDSYIVSVSMSDHRGCVIKAFLKETVRGPGYWKFNNSLLQDKLFVTEMNKLINANAANIDEDPILQWELLKVKIKEFSTAFSRLKATERKNKLLQLTNDLNDLDIKLSNNPMCAETLRRKEHVKLQIEVIEQYNARSAQTRARARWIELGEKNTSFFLNLEKSQANSKILSSVKNESGDLITKQEDIMKYQKDFYANLYKKRVNSNNMQEKINHFLDNAHVPQLSNDQRKSCEGVLLATEVLNALKEMKNGSAPGIDGITIEFIKMFWNNLSNLLTASFNYSFVNGKLSSTQCKAIIVLIHKGKNLERNDLSNWRPISLTNSDYKLLAKCLAIRLSTVIHDIVSSDQVGYIKGRRVSTLLRLVDDVTDQLNVLDKPGLLVTIDYTKAFDSISKDFMIEAFKKFGFGSDFLRWVKILMTSAKSCINYCGWLSEFFEVNSGIRQGCPFSPLAFVVAVEILAIKIRSSHNIKGLTYWCSNKNNLEEILKIALYADDITLFLTDAQDMLFALKIIDDFSGFSGLKINRQKSEAMWLGSKKNSKDKYYGFTWKTRIKCLGIYFSNSMPASQIEDNWKERIEAIKRVIVTWEKRNLSLMGKMCIIKTFLLSQLVYFMQAFIIPDKVLNSINTLLFRFLWRKKDCNKKAFEKVKRVVMCHDYQFGGLKMIDVRQMQESFLLQWAVNVCSSDLNDKWNLICTKLFQCFGGKHGCFFSNVKMNKFKGIENIKSSFWKAVLVAWLENNKVDHSNINPCLWNNSHFTSSGQVLFFKSWIENNIMYLTDIMNNKEIMSFAEICSIIGSSPSRFLEYVVVYNAVKTFLKTGKEYTTINNLPRVPRFHSKNLLKAKEFRQSLVQAKWTEPCAQNFWQRKFDIKLTEKHWLIAKYSTQETRLRLLHWKLLHNIYPTNIMLCKMKVRDNNYCSYCTETVDVIEHFFFECQAVRKFWRHVENYIYINFEVALKLTITDVLFGIVCLQNISESKTIKINHILLVAKMCISIYKKTNSYYSLNYIFESHLTLRNI
jgi:exonuclease III